MRATGHRDGNRAIHISTADTGAQRYDERTRHSFAGIAAKRRHRISTRPSEAKGDALWSRRAVGIMKETRRMKPAPRQIAEMT